jgi:hypothetical protein
MLCFHYHFGFEEVLEFGVPMLLLLDAVAFVAVLVECTSGTAAQSPTNGGILYFTVLYLKKMKYLQCI